MIQIQLLVYHAAGAVISQELGPSAGC